MELNILRDRAYKTACEHGFHEEELSNKHFMMLVITELSEAVESDRKENYGDAEKYIKAMNAYNGVDKSICFERHFNKYIKDSVADELADAAIRLLDLAGLRDIEVQRIETMDAAYVFKSMPFPECIYDIVLNIIKYGHSTPHCINTSLAIILALAKSRDIDILWHIEEKMKYNELRPNKHGKKY